MIRTLFLVLIGAVVLAVVGWWWAGGATGQTTRADPFQSG